MSLILFYPILPDLSVLTDYFSVCLLNVSLKSLMVCMEMETTGVLECISSLDGKCCRLITVSYEIKKWSSSKGSFLALKAKSSTAAFKYQALLGLNGDMCSLECVIIYTQNNAGLNKT